MSARWSMLRRGLNAWGCHLGWSLGLALGLSGAVGNAVAASPLTGALAPLRTMAQGAVPGVVQGSAGRFASTFATDTAMADYAFAWSEKKYPEYFSPANPPSQNVGGYYARHYTATDSWLAEKDGVLWLVMNSTPVRVDTLSHFAAGIGYAGSTASMSVGRAVAIEFVRAMIQYQIDRNQYLIDFDQMVMTDTRFALADLFAMEFAMDASTDSFSLSVSCYQCHHWTLNAEQTTQFFDELEKDSYYLSSMSYMEQGDLEAYKHLTGSVAAEYKTLAESIPASFSSYWK